MTSFTVSNMRNSNVSYLYRLRDQIELDPPYQRQGEVWSTAKKRLLIDSIINQFDVPKIYLHEHTQPIEVEGRRYKFSLIDGKQRLEAVWGYLDGDFALSDDFILLEDGSASAASKTYSELDRDEGNLSALLTSTNLDISLIRTDDVELIEEMFSRLNEAVPLNAAEKRNGRGGALREIVRNMVEHEFFTKKTPFRNTRYRQYDLALKFILWQHNGPRARDAKKRQLDEFWEANKASSPALKRSAEDVSAVLDAMAPIFEDSDRLLTSIGMVSLYYLCFATRKGQGQLLPRRDQLVAFNRARRLDNFEDEDGLTTTEKDYLEFDRFAQSPNDSSALTFRLGVLNRYLDSH